MIRVQLPVHLRNLAGTGKIVEIEVEAPVTPERIVETLEAAYPALKGGIRDRNTGKRRPMVRYFACEEDLSHVPGDTELPEAVATGREPFIILGAISGGETEPIGLPHISGPANRALQGAGITSLQDVARRTRKQIADLHGMGPKGLRMLEEALAHHNLTYADRAAAPGETPS